MLLVAAILSLQSAAAVCYVGTARVRPLLFSPRASVGPRMEADVQQQIESLEAQLKMMQLRAQIESLEKDQTAAAAQQPPASLAPAAPAPAEVAAPMPGQAVVPPAPQPPEETCLGLSGKQIECTEPVDLDELFGGLPSVNRVFDALPSGEQLTQLDTLLPLVAGLVALAIGFSAVTRATESLRPEDAATARRKREERELQGVGELEWEQEQERIARDSRDNWLVVVLVVVFELVLFNLRNV